MFLYATKFLYKFNIFILLLMLQIYLYILFIFNIIIIYMYMSIGLYLTQLMTSNFDWNILPSNTTIKSLFNR